MDEQKPKAQLEQKLDTILRQEETLWLQRSRNSWLREGDRNGKFFRISTSNGMRKNRISEIYHENKILNRGLRLNRFFLNSSPLSLDLLVQTMWKLTGEPHILLIIPQTFISYLPPLLCGCRYSNCYYELSTRLINYAGISFRIHKNCKAPLGTF